MRNPICGLFVRLVIGSAWRGSVSNLAASSWDYRDSAAEVGQVMLDVVMLDFRASNSV